MLVFLSSEERTGFHQSVPGEATTGAGEGYSLTRVPPLAVAEAGAESSSAVLGREEIGEVNGRQDEHHGLQHLLLSSTRTDNRGGKRRGGAQIGGSGGTFSGCAVFWFGRGGAGAFLFGGRERAGHRVLYCLQAQCFGFS